MWETDRQTDRPRCTRSVTIDRIYVRSTAMRSNNKIRFKRSMWCMHVSTYTNGIRRISTLTSLKPLNRFWWNSNLRTAFRRPLTMQNFTSIRRRERSRRIPSLALSGFFLCLSFFLFVFIFFVTHRGCTDGPILTVFIYRLCHTTSFRSQLRMCLSGISLMCLPIEIPKPQFGA